MTTIFPEVFDRAECLFPVKLKTQTAETPSPQSAGDKFIANARTTEDLEPLARVLRKNPELRKAVFKAMQAEGVLDSAD